MRTRTICSKKTHKRGGMKAPWAAAASVIVAASVCLARQPAAGPEMEVAPDPSRTTPVHRIPLYDADGEQVVPGGGEVKPFSQRVTCGKCHDCAKIERGWHFSAADANVPAGRPAQPWVLTDVATGTQIPVSARGWRGSHKPADIGLSSWRFVDRFGRHLPGGGLGERFADAQADPQTDRWEATGYLEINCLGCHHVSFKQNQDEWAKNVERGNYLEAGTAASGIAYVTGFVNRLPSTFDRMLGEAPDNPQFLPRVRYDRSLFNPKNEVFLDVPRKPSPDRCYYCHTNHPVGRQEWQVPEDVHVARGLGCTDCHKNGLDHQISRNYEGEETAARGYTCRGCHLGEAKGASEALRKGGHNAAPWPGHEGLPKLHLDKLACTACHSGPIPGRRARRVQTGRIHALGYHGIEYDPNAPPTVQEPVFVKQYDGKIAPHRMVFPAFFGRLKDGAVKPLLPEAVVQATGRLLATPEGKKPTSPSAEAVAAALKALGGEGVYVGGGKLYRLDGEGKLAGSDHAAAGPYSWPLAHDVRPAAQSLGVDEGCTDCHASDSPFLFGEVVAAAPADLGEPEVLPMHTFEGQDPTFNKLFGLTFIFREWLKGLGFFTSGVVLLILLAYGLPGLAVVLKRFSGRADEQ